MSRRTKIIIGGKLFFECNRATPFDEWFLLVQTYTPVQRFRKRAERTGCVAVDATGEREKKIINK